MSALADAPREAGLIGRSLHAVFTFIISLMIPFNLFVIEAMLHFGWFVEGLHQKTRHRETSTNTYHMVL